MPTPFDRRLAAYSLTAGLTMAAGGTAQAVIDYTDVNPDEARTFAGAPQDFELDVNGDGTIDFILRVGTQTDTWKTSGSDSIQVNYYYREVRPIAQAWPSSVGTGRNMVLGDWQARALNSNYLIGTTYASWASYSNIWMAWQGSNVYSTGKVNPTSGGYFLGRNRKMLGLAFNLADGWHYGWCRVSVDQASRSFTVHDYAYETDPDTPIPAGAFLDLILQGTVGNILGLGADEVPDTGGAFTAAPKLIGHYFDPVKGKKFTKATFKATLDAPAPAPGTVFTLKKKIRLYDAKAFKATYKAGDRCLDFLHRQPNQGMYFNLEAQHTQGAEPFSGLVAHVALLPPQINDFDGGPELGSILTITGDWFGVKPPKVWLEYRVANPKGGFITKALKLKVLKDFIYQDAKGKPTCMDPDSGASQIRVQFPDAWPKGWDDGDHFLVLDNGIGVTTAWDIDHLP
jgi:hypothetical protein